MQEFGVRRSELAMKRGLDGIKIAVLRQFSRSQGVYNQSNLAKKIPFFSLHGAD